MGLIRPLYFVFSIAREYYPNLTHPGLRFIVTGVLMYTLHLTIVILTFSSGDSLGALEEEVSGFSMSTQSGFMRFLNLLSDLLYLVFFLQTFQLRRLFTSQEHGSRTIAHDNATNLVLSYLCQACSIGQM